MEVIDQLGGSYRDSHGVSNNFKAFWHTRPDYVKRKILGSFPERAGVIVAPMLTGRLYNRAATVDEIYSGIVDQFYKAYRNGFTHQGKHSLPSLKQIDRSEDFTLVDQEVLGTGFFEANGVLIENRFPLLPEEAKAIVQGCESIAMLLHGADPRPLPEMSAEEYLREHYQWSTYLNASPAVEAIHNGFINVLKAVIYVAICERIGTEPEWWIFSGSEIAKRHNLLI